MIKIKTEIWKMKKARKLYEGDEAEERKCPVCGRHFIRSPLHIYMIDKIKPVCSYGCRSRYEREHPKKKYRTIR
jgi:hypothetical protein